MKEYDDFKGAFRSLNNVNTAIEPFDQITTVGLVWLYSLCFDMSYKLMKALLLNEGISDAFAGSYTDIITLADSCNMINDKETWLEALVSRNNVAYSYNENIALDIIKKTKDSYYQMFCTLDKTIITNWI